VGLVPADDPLVSTPRLGSFRLDSSWYGGRLAALCEFGHQGLAHDDEFGLIYNRHRYLSPSLASFVQRDPAGYVDGMSLYEYEGSSPMDTVDPTGMDLWVIDYGRLIPGCAWIRGHSWIEVSTWTKITRRNAAKCSEVQCECFKWVRRGFAGADMTWAGDSMLDVVTALVFVARGKVEIGYSFSHLPDAKTLLYSKKNRVEDIAILQALQEMSEHGTLYQAAFHNCLHWAVSQFERLDAIVLRMPDYGNGPICAVKGGGVYTGDAAEEIWSRLQGLYEIRERAPGGPGCLFDPR